jgi:phenylacetic acid degradation operon negative regulatory protein
MRANGFEAQPQDLVMTFSVRTLVPHDRVVWSGGLVTLLRRLRLLDGRIARRSGAHGPPRRGLERLRSGRLVSYRPTPRTVALLGGGRPADLLLGARAASRELWTRCGTRSRRSAGWSAPASARRLRFLGFGSVQDGDVDLAPRPRAEVVALIDDSASAVAGHGRAVRRRLDFARSSRPRPGISTRSTRYRAFIDEFSRTVAADEHEHSGCAPPRARFRRFPALDPELRRADARAAFTAREAVALFHRLYRRSRRGSGTSTRDSAP